jgi:hypothetical protein
MTAAERLRKRYGAYLSYAQTSARLAADGDLLASVRAGHARAEQRWRALAEIDRDRLATFHQA